MPFVVCTISLISIRMQVKGGYIICGLQYITCCIVTAIRFANDDKSLLACASRDGILSVFNLTSEPPSLVATLRGHHRPVNGDLSS